MSQFMPSLGLGLGWRPELALLIDRHPGLGFVEVIAEDLDPGGKLPEPLDTLCRRGMAVIPHGITLSLGGAEPIDSNRVKALGQLARRLKAPLVSEHIAFVRGHGIEAGHLLPLPRNQTALDLLVENVCMVREHLPVPLALENVASLFEWPDGEKDEATFLAEVLERADVLLLLDIANVYANARNHGFDAVSFLDRIPLERLAYAHIAGGIERNGLYHDTHAHPVSDSVLQLLEELCSRVRVPGVLLERDDCFPSDLAIKTELDRIATAVEHGNRRREVCHAVP
jgi:uncharacterized protein (UPF0276 family)